MTKKPSSDDSNNRLDEIIEDLEKPRILGKGKRRKGKKLLWQIIDWTALAGLIISILFLIFIMILILAKA